MPPHSTPRKHVLLVDDCPATREMINMILSVEGCTVTCVADGQAALDQLRSQLPPDLILLDLNMPVLNGWEFLRQKNQDPSLARIPVVILSAIGDGVDDLSSLGVVCSITKPIPEDTLIDKVVEAIRIHCPSDGPSQRA